MQITTPLREITCHMGSHSVTCHPAEVTFSPLPQSKLVLDLATLEGCKAELTWVVVTSWDSLPAKDGPNLSKNNQAVSWLGIEPATKNHKSDVLTTTPLVLRFVLMWYVSIQECNVKPGRSGFCQTASTVWSNKALSNLWRGKKRYIYKLSYTVWKITSF